MRKRVSRTKVALLSGAIAAFFALGVVSSASAFAPPYDRFNFCPVNTAGVFKCLKAVTPKGSVVIGKKTVPIVNAVTLQGGQSAPNGEGISTFFGATNGVTL